MKLNHLLNFILFIIICQNCQVSYYFYQSDSCSFFFNYADVNCTKFQLTYCHYTDYNNCIYYSTTNGTTTCLRYDVVNSTDWTTCTQSCCQKSVTYNQTSEFFGQCQDYIEKSQQLGRIVGAAIGGGIGLIIIIAFIIGFRDKCSNCACQCKCDCCHRCWNRNNVESEQHNRNHVSPENHEHFSSNNLKELFQKSWKKGALISVVQSDCAICLGGKPNLLTSCHHLFHANCFEECMKKKVECVLCRNYTFGTFRIYCTKCLANFYELQMKDIKDIVGGVQDICNECYR